MARGYLGEHGDLYTARFSVEDPEAKAAAEAQQDPGRQGPDAGRL